MTKPNDERLEQVRGRMLRRYRSTDAYLSGLKEDRDDIDFLLSRLEEAEKRADDNFTSYERVKGLYSETANLLTQQTADARTLGQLLTDERSLRDRMIEVVEQKRDALQRQHGLVDGDTDLVLKLSLEGDIRVVNEIITALKEIDMGAAPADEPCTWEMLPDNGNAPHVYYRSECGIMASRKQQWWQHCPLCGRALLPATKTEEE